MSPEYRFCFCRDFTGVEVRGRGPCPCGAWSSCWTTLFAYAAPVKPRQQDILYLELLDSCVSPFAEVLRVWETKSMMPAAGSSPFLPPDSPPPPSTFRFKNRIYESQLKLKDLEKKTKRETSQFQIFGMWWAIGYARRDGDHHLPQPRWGIVSFTFYFLKKWKKRRKVKKKE